MNSLFSKVLVLAVVLLAFSTGAQAALAYSSRIGGAGGIPFNECNSKFLTAGRVSAIFGRTGAFIDGVQFLYGTTRGFYYGGNSTNVFPTTYFLNPNENVVSVRVTHNGLYLTSLSFITNAARTLTFGVPTANPVTYSSPGRVLRCYYGAASRYVNNIGFGFGALTETLP